MQKYWALFTDVPYLASTVNHATKNETAKITVTPYLAGMVNHAMKNEIMKITDSIFIWHLDIIGWKERGG